MLHMHPLLRQNVVISRKGLTISGTTSHPDQVVTVTTGEQTFTLTPQANGAFSYYLSAEAIQPPLIIADADSQHRIDALHIGFVSLFSGQSNMQFPMAQADHFAQEKAWLATQSPAIYFFNVPEQQDGSPENLSQQDAWPTAWEQVTSDNLGMVSAVAYYAAKAHCLINPHVPFGIVLASKGGTSASSWLPEDDLDSPLLQALFLHPYRTLLDTHSVASLYQAQLDFEAHSQQYWQRRHKWLADHPDQPRAAMKAVIGHTPWPPPMTPWSYRRPGTLFNTMIAPLTPFKWDAISWYQGEEDTLYGGVYVDLLRRLIQRWQQLFDATTPWYLIQLPAYREAGKDWSAVRLAQLKVSQQLSHVHLVSGVDVGDPDNIHPADKTTLGQRLGRALATQQGTPTAQLWLLDAEQIVIKVSHTQQLTATRSPQLLVNDQLTPVQLVDDTIIIAKTAPLRHLAYGLGNVPDIMIFNEHDEPLSPFEWFF